jgi:tetratricopeptide (TPR) repeat protein
MWDAIYNKSENILKLVKNRKTLDYLEIKAYDCYYLNQLQCAKSNFSTLYSATYKLEYAYKLIDVYFFLGDVGRANRLISRLLKAYPKVRKLKEYNRKLIKLRQSRLLELRKKYKKSKKFEDLQKIVFILINSKQNQEAYKMLEEYIIKHPKDVEAQFWYATYLSWGDENDKALKILENIKDDSYPAKLLIAKILAWGGEYEKSMNYLNDIIMNSDDRNLIIDANEFKGLEYYWQHDYEKAKPILKEVLKYKITIEAKEALMIMQGDVKPLIKKYTILHNREPLNLEYILKIAQFSEIIKDINTSIKFYEMYYKFKPNPNIAHSLALLYLTKKNVYKAFGYYEYWAYHINSEKSLLELAKAYYYNGYNQSALDVINDILKLYPDSQGTISLKAKILKYNPKFTQNNSQKNVRDILNSRSEKLLKLANRLYFNGFYAESNKYFKKYILENADDYEARERYAYSLEFSGKYKEAGAEFFLLSWMKKDCNIIYHYGFNLEKTGKKIKAKKVYEEAKSYAIKPLNDRLTKFIDEWKKSWESLDVNKYKKFYAKRFRNNRLWLLRKENIFKNVKFISVYLAGESIISKKVYKNSTIYKVKFYQQYTTDKKKDIGYKILKIKCDKKECLIYNEKWRKGKFIPADYTCYDRVTKRINILNKVELDKALKKKPLKEDEVFATLNVNVTNKFSLSKRNIQNNNKFGILGLYDEDNTKLQFLQYGAYYKYKDFYVDIQKWRLYQNDNDRNGKFATLKFKISDFTFGGEVGKYEDSKYIYPYLAYENYFTFKVYKSLTGKDKQSFCAIDNNLSSVNFSISKYKGANASTKKDITDYWFSLAYSKISDKNSVITPQFQYRLNQNAKIFPNSFNLYYYLSGWYMSNSKENSCYYSPKKYDSTFFELHPTYKNLELIGKIGYSFKGKSSLYSYGFDYQYSDNLKFNCMKNYSYRDNISGYSYVECNLDVGLSW